MNLDERIANRLEQLIDAGDSIAQGLGAQDYYGSDHTLAQQVSQWTISCGNLLDRVFGSSSPYYIEFSECRGAGLEKSYIFNLALGALKAAGDDYKHGFLFEVRNIVAAEVFDEFLGQAEYLLGAGYQAPAAVIAGSVLEDGLRKLCQRHGIALSAKPKLDTMNADLYKVGAYNLLVQKKITALADIRNNAAHGQWDQFTVRDVEDMLNAVRTFMAQHFM